MLIGTRRALARGSGARYPHASSNALDGIVPGFIIDRKGRNTLGNVRVPLSRLLTCTNASTVRTSVLNGQIVTWPANAIRFDDSTGVHRMLFEGARTNLVLNSGTLVTQSVTTTATSYTISFYGTGSVTLSGTATGTLSGTGAANRVQLTFTATAGTLTLTVTGSVAFAQCEVGTVATSYIPTTGAAVAVTTDVVQFSAAALVVVSGSGATLAWRGYIPRAVTGQIIMSEQSSTPMIYPDNATPTTLTAYGPISPTLFGTGLLPGALGACMGWGASGGRICANGGTVVDATFRSNTMTALYLGYGSGLVARQVMFVDQIVGWALADRPTSAAVQAQARAAN